LAESFDQSNVDFLKEDKALFIADEKNIIALKRQYFSNYFTNGIN
jgi:hypothetical protein